MLGNALECSPAFLQQSARPVSVRSKQRTEIVNVFFAIFPFSDMGSSIFPEPISVIVGSAFHMSFANSLFLITKYFRSV